nr:MAG TPA_asm: hypothetical protein [Caudoviricetes sp.]
MRYFKTFIISHFRILNVIISLLLKFSLIIAKSLLILSHLVIK